MSTESPEHSRDALTYPSEKIFTLPEVKEDAYAHIFDRIVALEWRKLSEGIIPQIYNRETLKSIIYEYFGSVIRIQPRSLGLPDKVLLPSGEKSWKDIPLLKSSGEVSIESIVSGETRLLINGRALKNLQAYWETTELILHSLQRDFWDFSGIKNIRLLQDDTEAFRIGLKDTQNDKIAKHGKQVTSVLRVEYTDGREKLINLQDNYRAITSPKTEKDRTTLTKIQEERKELKDSMNREPLFGGSLSYEYAVIGGAALIWSAVRVVKSIRYRMESGRMMIITPVNPIQWTKEQITGLITKEMQSSGFLYNEQTLSWEDILEKTRNTIRKKLPWMSASELHARTWLLVQAAVWNDIQKNPEKYMSKTPYRDLMKKGVKWILNHGILFPLDVLLASEVATYSNASTVFSASSDLAAFYLGQKSVDLVSKLVPGGAGRSLKLLRFPAWIAATMYSNRLWKEALEGNKKKWQYIYQDGFGSIYTDGQSTTLNILWWGFVNFGLDQTQKDKKTWDQLYDVGTMPGVFNIFGNELFQVPEVNFFQHKIDLATDPGDWLRGQPGRTIDDWNTQIDKHLPHHTLRLIRSLVERMKESKHPFTPAKIRELNITKEDLLMQTLNTLLSGWNDPSKWPVDVKGNILLSVEKELKWWWKWESSMNKVTEVVYSQVPKLKIDRFFMEHYYPTQVLFHQTHIGSMIGELAKYISPKELQYIQSLQERMEKNLPLCEEWKWTKTEVLGMSSNKLIPSETNAIFQGLLDNKMSIKATLDINPKSKPVDTTVGEYFAYMLNFLLEQKRRKEFYNEVQKWNKKWVQWTL